MRFIDDVWWVFSSQSQVSSSRKGAFVCAERMQAAVKALTIVDQTVAFAYGSAIRSDADFMAAHQGELMYSGQFGTLCGVPVLFSRLVPEGMVIITEKPAVKFFVKREAGLEQSRDIEKKENTIVYERHGVIALVDDTSSVILGKSAPALTATAALANGKITLSAQTETGQTVRYMLDADAPLLSDDLSGWQEWNGVSTVDAGGASRIALAAVDAAGAVKASVSLTL